MNRLIVFDSVHHAIRAERLLLQSGIAAEMIPTPREISASCGQSVAFEDGDDGTVRQLLEQEALSFKGIYAADPKRRRYDRIYHKGHPGGDE